MNRERPPRTGGRARWRPRSHGPSADANVDEASTNDAEPHARRGRGGYWRGRRYRGRGSSQVRPNFFVGFRVANATIVKNIELIQRRIVDQFPGIETCMIDPRTLHVTLCVLQLPDDAAIQQAAEILRRIVSSVAIPAFIEDPPAFTFHGLKFFGQNSVLYTPLDVTSPHAASLAQLAESLHDAFGAVGFTTEAFRSPFIPHLTIWKTSKDRELICQLNRQRPRDRPLQASLAEFLLESEPSCSEVHIGIEQPTSVELLSMGEKEPGGYYRTHASESLISN